MPTLQAQTHKKYLIVGPAWVGDMIMSQTLYKFIKEKEPTAIIDVLAPKSTVALLALMPEVRRAITLDLGHGDLNLKKRYKLGRNLRQESYDHVLVTPNSLKSALIPFFAKIPRRTGWLGEQRYFLLNDIRRLDPVKYPLMIERFAALALDKTAALPAELPKPRFFIPPEQIQSSWHKIFGDREPSKKKILALCPGAEFGPAKRWPYEYYAELAKTKLAEGWEVWLFGSPKESEAAELIQKTTDNGCVDLIGKTGLLDAIALLSMVSLVVSNDSGLMHVAAALAKPLVVIYGSSSPKFTPPLSEQVKILSLGLECSPCFKRNCPLEHLNCLKGLKPELVLKAIDELEQEQSNDFDR